MSDTFCTKYALKSLTDGICILHGLAPESFSGKKGIKVMSRPSASRYFIALPKEINPGHHFFR